LSADCFELNDCISRNKAVNRPIDDNVPSILINNKFLLSKGSGESFGRLTWLKEIGVFGIEER
jgi:hypothetical protein